jgi:hypothetical protein
MNHLTQKNLNMRSMLFWDATQPRFVAIGISGKPIGPIFKDQAVGPIGCPETSVTNNQYGLGNITKQYSSI